MNKIELTAESAKLFEELVNDSGNWSGCPMLCITKGQRGNLTDLKAKGLLTTMTEEGIQYADFTDLGVEYAASIGLKVTY